MKKDRKNYIYANWKKKKRILPDTLSKSARKETVRGKTQSGKQMNKGTKKTRKEKERETKKQRECGGKEKLEEFP